MPDGVGKEAPSGEELYALVERLYPLCRSITGNGVRETLRIVGELIPLEIREVPSGTQVFDWTVPPEWNLHDAWIADAAGRRIVDLADSTLRVVSYSEPLRRRVARKELEAHLHSLPEHPDWIPYRTSYYHRSWGFCVTQREREALAGDEFEVCIDATLEPGHLSYGELLLPGETSDEVLISAHVCHPSLADDNLSGISVAAHLARALQNAPHRYSYRFLFAPGTIGALTWLAHNRESLGRVRHGLTLVCLGDAHPPTYKRTLAGDAEIDRAAARVLREYGSDARLIDYFPFGYDERQYNAPGFRLPVGSLMRGRHGLFPEYHTSADDLSFVRPERLEESWRICRDILTTLEGNHRYRNLHPFGEPQLGRRGIYRALGGEAELEDLQLALLWVLALSDGNTSLLQIAERSDLPFRVVRAAADLLLNHDILGEIRQ